MTPQRELSRPGIGELMMTPPEILAEIRDVDAALRMDPDNKELQKEKKKLVKRLKEWGFVLTGGVERSNR